MSTTHFLLLIHGRQALNNLKYAVRSWEGVSPSFIEKECNFGVMHKNESPKVTVISN